jgi:VWFA-related protein
VKSLKATLPACLCAGIALLAAQDQPRQPFQTEVNYIRVDMYPTAGGKPVTDLAAEDVEVLEDGVPQRVANFEHISITGPRSQTTERDPSTVADMRRAAADPRARLFVLFIDPRFVGNIASAEIRRPLVDALNRLVGGNDLIAVMTPSMSAQGLTFRRRTEGIEALLAERWGEREWPGITDPVEFKYEACYPDLRGTATAGISPEMIRRRREKLTLDALEDLAAYLSWLREERKAVITISEGWPLYGPNRQLTRPIDVSIGVRPVVIDPKTGRPTAGDPTGLKIDYATCENDRVALSEIMHEQRFLRIMQAANRGNVSFYPIDPRGLLASSAPPPSLRTMADMTDGLAIVNAGSMDAGLRRMVDDLSSYYLLGYYSPVKADGRFHRITVRVKRPGVDVRARPGYLAEKGLSTRAGQPAPAAANAASPADTAETRLIAKSLGALSAFSRERPLHLQAVAGSRAPEEAGVWTIVEVARNAGGEDWSKGGTADFTLVDASGTSVATAQAPLLTTAGPISARVFLKPSSSAAAGEYQVRVKAIGAGVLPASDSARVSLNSGSGADGALFSRRGITTGNREVPTADLRFRRTERLIALVPTLSADPVSARLLDRAGNAMGIPVTASIRQDADGSRWRAADVLLAPLAAGDYLIELTTSSERTVAAFRVLP